MDRAAIIKALSQYDPNFDELKINKAIDFAIHYHGSQKRESGELYYNHPLEVAEIIIKMRLDSNSVIAALLHDTIEDTDLTLEIIDANFGPEVAKLVDGLTKISKIEFIPDHKRQAENFSKLLLAMSEDLRVLLVKLADRLHNMRTIYSIKSDEKRKRIAIETMEIYAPLAERIGIQKIKVELQDICFKILQPEVRESIINRLENIVNNDDLLVNKIIEAISEIVDAKSHNWQVSGRRKTPYSIWMKMKQKNVGLEQLSDVMAFRITVDSLISCYQVLGLIHTHFKMVPESFQDFISVPKNNGYQSIHTVIIGPFQHKIEIQIRTKDMHEIAELGVAAHWRYKQNHHDVTDGMQYKWIRELLTILEQSSDPEDFLQNTKLAMDYDQVLCFTPKGNIIALPKGATIIDFAYAVHSNIGNKCIGAKVNGRIAPLKSIISNGDQIEIITAKNQVPSPAWESFVITGKARSEVRKFIRSQQKDQYIKLGRSLLEKAFKQASIINFETKLNDIYGFFKKKNTDELYYAIAENSITREEVIKHFLPKTSKIESAISKLISHKKKALTLNQETAVPIKGLISGMAMHMAGCCHPLPGDKIAGALHSGTGVTIHVSDCAMLKTYATTPEKIINVTWDTDVKQIPFVSRIKIVTPNEPFSLVTLSSEITKEKGSIRNFKVINKNEDFIETIFDIETYSVAHIEKIIQSLKMQRIIQHIERYKS